MTDNKKRFSILHLNASNFYGGPEKQIVEHLKRLDQKKFNGIVASFLENGRTKSEILQKAEAEKIPVFPIPMNSAVDFSALSRLEKIIRQNKIDLICTHGYKSTIMGWYTARKTGIPIAAYSRGYTAEDKKVAFYEWLERKVLQKVDSIIAVSEGQKNKLFKMGVNKKPVLVIHNAIEVSVGSVNYELVRKEITQELKLDKNALLAVTAGRLSPEKGHRYLVQAAALIKNEVPRLNYIFCGNGVLMDDLKKQAEELNVIDICHFIGFRRDINKIFAAMDFLILPSLTEGLPNVVLEAFANKKPVVSTAVGGVPELISENLNGFMVPAERADLLAEKIKLMAASQKQRSKMGQAGFETVKKYFSFEDQNLKLEKLYLDILNIN